MPRFVALLRGINVGGRGKVAMADLRAVAGDLGWTGVSTYIQSGNLLFTAARGGPASLAAALEKQIASQLGVRPAVVVVPAAELAAVIAANPFPGEPDPRMVHVVFRGDDMTAAGRTAVADAAAAARAAGSADEAVIAGRALFLHTPGGFGRSKLAARLASSPAQQGGTARNWATVTRLHALLSAGDG